MALLPTGVEAAPGAPWLNVGQGEVVVTASASVLTTILGSCVSVCLWDRCGRAGGMNHFVLPGRAEGEINARYGTVAMAVLMDGLLELGCRAEDLQAKVFGGAAVLPHREGRTVGSSNVDTALAYLRAARVPVVAQRTGGLLGQHIRFDTGDGNVMFRWLPHRLPVQAA
jgi:chemotaxis protein CheD